MKKTLSLEFSCCGCSKKVGVTLECKGESLERPGWLKVKVPCPTCGEINEVYFEMTGKVHLVRANSQRVLPVPSMN